MKIILYKYKPMDGDHMSMFNWWWIDDKNLETNLPLRNAFDVMKRDVFHNNRSTI
jgi:hypothetical protein